MDDQLEGGETAKEKTGLKRIGGGEAESYGSRLGRLGVTR